MESNPQFKMSEALLDHGITKSGILPIANFKEILQRRIFLSNEETSQLIMNYDPMNRQQIKVPDFLNDLKEQVFDAGLRIQLTEIS